MAAISDIFIAFPKRTFFSQPPPVTLSVILIYVVALNMFYICIPIGTIMGVSPVKFQQKWFKSISVIQFTHRVNIIVLKKMRGCGDYGIRLTAIVLTLDVPSCKHALYGQQSS